MNQYFRLNLRLNQGRNRSGKTYRVYHTSDFGFDCTVNINGNSTPIQQDEEGLFIVYVPQYAKLSINESGAVLSVINPEDLKSL